MEINHFRSEYKQANYSTIRAGKWRWKNNDKESVGAFRREKSLRIKILTVHNREI